MLYSMTLIQGARALRTANPLTKTSFTEFQSLKAHARTHTTKNPKSDKTSGRTHDADDKHTFTSSNTWKDTLLGIFGAGGAITGGIIINAFLAKALRPQLGAQERRADQALLYYVHGY